MKRKIALGIGLLIEDKKYRVRYARVLIFKLSETLLSIGSSTSLVVLYMYIYTIAKRFGVYVCHVQESKTKKIS